MTRDERYAARLACLAATCGPWEWQVSGELGYLAAAHSDRITVSVLGNDARWVLSADSWFNDCRKPTITIRRDDAAFILLARTALPAALAELDRLDALLAKYGIDPQTGEPTPCLTTT